MHSLASKLAGESIDWTSICRAVVRTKPPYEANLGSMCSFVASKAGGPTGMFLKYLHSVHGQFVSAQKKQALPSGLYRVLADFPLHYVAIAIWAAAYTGPSEKVSQGGVCEWVAVGEVSALVRSLGSWVKEDKYGGLSPKLAMLSAEKILSQVRVRLPAAGVKDSPVENAPLVAVLARLDIRMATLLLKKQDASAESFPHPGGVLAAFLVDLQEAFPKADVTVFADLWTVPPPAASASASAPKATSVLQKDVDAMPLAVVGLDGSLQDGRSKMRAVGYELGRVVTAGSPVNPVAPPGMHRIVGIEGDTVFLEALDKPNLRSEASVLEFLNGGWVEADEKTRSQLFENWQLNRVFNAAAGAEVQRKATVVAALAALSGLVEQTTPASSWVDVFVKPTRKVVAKRACPLGQLVLVPETLNIKVEPAASGPVGGFVPSEGGCDSRGYVEVSFEPAEPSKFFLAPATGEKAMGPLWFVRLSSDRKDVNLEWAMYETQTLIGADFHPGALGVKPPAAADKPTAGKRSRGKKAPSERGGPGEAVVEHTLRIPVLINSLPLKGGDELVAFRPTALKKEAGPLSAITYTSLSKRAKTTTK